MSPCSIPVSHPKRMVGSMSLLLKTLAVLLFLFVLPLMAVGGVQFGMIVTGLIIWLVWKAVRIDERDSPHSE